MTNPTTGPAGRRPINWAEFYKNGPPKEIIVIDDDTPPPSSVSSSSSSASLQHVPNGHHPASPRYGDHIHGMPPSISTSSSHPATSHYQFPAPTHPSSSTGMAPERTRRMNKRLPSTELVPPQSSSTVNGGISNQHYVFPGPPQHPPTSYPASASHGSYASGGPHQVMYASSHAQAPPSHYPTVSLVNGDSNISARKKRKPNGDVKYNQGVTLRENQVGHYPPAPTNIANVPPQSQQQSAANRDAQHAPWDDKEGHYQALPDSDVTTRYKIIRLLGQGTFGKVVECYDRESGQHCAIKIIRAIPKYRDASKIEMRVLNALKRNDPHNLYKCLHMRHYFDFKNHICMVFDLLGQSIYDWLKDNSFCPFPPSQIQYFARQLLTSVSFLHRLGLIHTDLKPENILLANGAYQQVPYKKSPTKMRRILLDPEIRLIDFGSATFQNEHHSSVVSTRHYRAPEIILGLGWSFPCDIWSIGCILVEFLTGEALFQTHDNLEHLAMMQAVLGPIPDKLIRTAHKSSQKYFVHGRLDYPNNETKGNSKKYVRALRPLRDYVVPTGNRPDNLQFAADFMDLLSRLLTYDPAERITASQALRHPYFSYILDDNGQVLGFSKTTSKSSSSPSTIPINNSPSSLPSVSGSPGMMPPSLPPPVAPSSSSVAVSYK